MNPGSIESIQRLADLEEFLEAILGWSWVRFDVEYMDMMCMYSTSSGSPASRSTVTVQRPLSPPTMTPIARTPWPCR